MSIMIHDYFGQDDPGPVANFGPFLCPSGICEAEILTYKIYAMERVWREHVEDASIYGRQIAGILKDGSAHPLRWSLSCSQADGWISSFWTGQSICTNALAMHGEKLGTPHICQIWRWNNHFW